MAVFCPNLQILPRPGEGPPACHLTNRPVRSGERTPRPARSAPSWALPCGCVGCHLRGHSGESRRRSRFWSRRDTATHARVSTAPDLTHEFWACFPNNHGSFAESSSPARSGPSSGTQTAPYTPTAGRFLPARPAGLGNYSEGNHCQVHAPRMSKTLISGLPEDLTL